MKCLSCRESVEALLDNERGRMVRPSGCGVAWLSSYVMTPAEGGDVKDAESGGLLENYAVKGSMSEV